MAAITTLTTPLDTPLPLDGAPVRVLFLAGTGRSGSTVLANLLGEVPSFVSVGELRYVFERGRLENRLCGCGQPFHQCPFWGQVFERAYGEARVPDRAIVLGGKRGLRARNLPALLTVEDPERWVQRNLRGYLAAYGRVLPAITEVSGASWVVDSSKLPLYGFALSQLPNVDVRALHLVRDPRATAFSWRRKKPLADNAQRASMQQLSPAKSSLLWDLWNEVTPRLMERASVPTLLLRYEDLVSDPRREVRRVLEWLGQEPASLPFVSDSEVRLGVNHTVAGNPNRLERGVVELRADDEWRAKMSPGDRALVTTITAPFLHSFGYRLRSLDEGDAE